MTYSLNDPLTKVTGIGERTAQQLARLGINTILDLLLLVPLRYEDRSNITTIDQLQLDQNHTILAKVVSVNERFKSTKGKRLRITQAIIADDTGQTRCIWFNNRFIKQNLKIDQRYFFAGEYTRYHSLTQPTVEAVSEDTIHTGRLVPLYTQTTQLKQGNLRRFLKRILDNLIIEDDFLAEEFGLLKLSETFMQLHFPSNKKLVIKARERLALEELITLIQHSEQIKQTWQQYQSVAQLPANTVSAALSNLPNSIPFQLTQDQEQALQEILSDLTQPHPMNRLLIGDVGTGKTVVAGLAAWQLAQAGFNCALIAPTQILAEQHQQTFSELLPDLPIKLLTATTTKNKFKKNKQPTLYIGTHAVINQLDVIKPALVIFDEQHRFGAAQRASPISTQPTSQTATQQTNPTTPAKPTPTQPHLLTMSATPIPRSYMLTIFSHLDLSLIIQSPFGPKPIKTWYVPSKKQMAAYDWVIQQLLTNHSTPKHSPTNSQTLSHLTTTTQNKKLAMIVCPFIEPSEQAGFERISAATQVFTQLNQKWGKRLKLALLHGQQKPAEQEKVISQLFANKLDLLVATSIVEVGVDLPQANIMVIEGADRFGLASLHQLRGRVGRQGQEAYCLLFSSSTSPETTKRLRLFAQENDGLKLAELDLQNRGPGELFGLEQHGWQTLRFASWSDAKLIKRAKTIQQKLDQKQQDQTISFTSQHTTLTNTIINN